MRNNDSTQLTHQKNAHAAIAITEDDLSYVTDVQWNGEAELNATENGGRKNAYQLTPASAGMFEFTCVFARGRELETVTSKPAEVFEQAEADWSKFWQSGGAVDFSQCTDPRARELERRVVLSQYLTALQCSGFAPPAETGLTCNSWFGKAHLEMHWWHAAHFALWGRADLLKRSMQWYQKIAMPAAAEIAQRQGYKGVRWGKMIGPNAEESPSSVGEFLIWQQPHPIYYSELLYRAKPTETTLKQYQKIVFETAAWMADYSHKDAKTGKYILGPPLIPAQEIYHARETSNPPYELAYWHWALETAQQWRTRLGMERDAKWDDVIKNLAPMPHDADTYLNTAEAKATFSDVWHRHDHPTVLAAIGMIPSAEVDHAMMVRTMEKVLKTWDWPSTWGWDFPHMAMTAARLHRPDLALDCLLLNVPKNTYLANGQNYQEQRLPLYLPGNGGILSAVAMMAAGWDGEKETAPGFPKDGKWNVRFEGLKPMP